jgi:hypothetical protein
LGLALHNYESTFTMLPMNGGSTSYSPQARLLPYMDQANLQNLINFEEPLLTGPISARVLNPIYVNVANAVIPTFLCPSDPAPSVYSVPLGAFAGNNYMVSLGSGTGTNYDDRHRTDGIAWQRSNARLRDVTDGTSNSVFMSESIRSEVDNITLPAGVMDQFPYRRTLNLTTGTSSNPSGPGFNATGGVWPGGLIQNPDLASIVMQGTNWVGAATGTGRGNSWMRGLNANVSTSGYITPNSRIPNVTIHGAGFFGPSSFHTGGAHALFGDGTVRFLSDNINTALHRALHSINGGEVVGEF